MFAKVLVGKKYANALNNADDMVELIYHNPDLSPQVYLQLCF